MTQKLFEKILVATDGSDRNKAAVDEALRIGRVCGSAIYAVFVIDSSIFESASGGVAAGDAWNLMQGEAATTLARIKDNAAGVNFETVILEGKPAAEIVRYAGEEKFDLIVIGTQGKKGFERLLLGSVAESVVRSTPCRVLVVK
ncbi:MAG: universal stress protein [Methanoregula sp.]|jgi:nucleotide-binding universal stress UspA family protein|nr:universal stress protein [Methanoregula sp.]